MSRASSGMLCPLCGKYSSVCREKFWRHAGDVPYVYGTGFMDCRASGFSPEMAALMRVNKDAGRHAYRCEDGTWIGES